VDSEDVAENAQAVVHRRKNISHTTLSFARQGALRFSPAWNAESNLIPPHF
jgi:hypothetical protein